MSVSTLREVPQRSRHYIWKRLGLILAACAATIAGPVVNVSSTAHAYSNGLCDAYYDNCYWLGDGSNGWDDYYRTRTASAHPSSWIRNRDSSFVGTCFWSNTGWTGTPYYLPYAGTGTTGISFLVRSHSRFNTVTDSSVCPAGR